MAKTYRELLEEKGFRSTTESDSVAGRKKPSYRDLVNSHNASYDAYKANNLVHSSAQYKAQEAQKQAIKEEETRKQQEQRQRDAQKHVETVQKLTNQYMPVRPDPIPQVDITKKYGPVSELTKRGATIASSSVSDAPFGFGKIIDLSGDGGSMSVRNSATEEADRERREREERDKKDNEAYQSALDRVNTGRGGKLGVITPKNDIDIFQGYKGNAKLINRPTVSMGGEDYGTVYSITIQDDDGQWINIPSIYDGKLHTEEEAIARYKKIGEHVGKYPDLKTAESGAQALSDAMGVYVQNRGNISSKQETGWDYDANRAQDLRRVEQEDELANRYQLPSNSRGGRIVSDKVALEGALETADRERAEFAQRDMQGTKEREAVLERNLSVEDLQAKRAAAEKDIEQYNKVLEWVPSPQNVDAYQNYLAAQTQKKAAQEGIEQIDTFTMIKQLKDQASKETDPFELADINSKLQAAEYKYEWSTMDPEERVKTWVWQRVERGFRNFNRAYYGLTTDFVADILGIDRLEVSTQNQKQLDVINKEIAYQAQSTSKLQGAAGDILTMAVENLPNIVLSFLGGGGLGVAANAAMDLKTAAAPMVTKFLNSFTKMVKNPMFWNSFIRSAGSNYIDEHDIKGNDPIISVTAGSIKGFLDSVIEVGGGIETGEIKPLGPASIIQSGFEEMGEELFQGPVSNAYDFSQSGKGADTKLEDIVSWDNPNAIISGKQMAQEGIMGFAGGAALSGMQQAGVAAAGAVKGQDLSAEPRSEYNYPEANIDQQIAQKEAEIAQKEAEARGTADRERMETELRDSEAETKYNDLVQLVTETFPEESATVKKITEAGPINIKRMEEIATGAISEFTKLMRSNPELTEKADAMKQAVVGLFEGIRNSGARNVERAREYGQAGIRLDDIASEIGEDNVNDVLRQAYDEGRQTAIQRAEEQESAIKEAGPQQSRKGVLRSISPQEADKNGVEPITKLTKTIRAATNALRGFAEDTGINVVLFESPVNDLGEHTGKDGWYDRNTQTVYLDVKSGYGNEEAMMRTAGHEITHFIKQYAPKYYETIYKQNVIKALYDQDPGTLQRMVKDQIRKAAENGKTQTLVQAMDEVIADTSQTMLFGGEATIKKLVSDNPKLFVRVKRWIDNFVKSIRKAVHNIGPDSEGAKILSKSYDAFKEIQSNYWKAMQEASVNLRGELRAEEMSAYEEAHEKAQAAKNAKIGTSVTVPGANQYVRPENPINEAMPDAIESRASEDVPDFGAMFADAVDENAVQNMTDEEAQALLNLPNANKLAQEGKKPATKPDFGAMFEASINEEAVANAPQEALDIVNDMKLPGNKPSASKPALPKPGNIAPVKTPLSEVMANKRYSTKFKNLAKKWAANEWVNIDLNKDSQDGYNFLQFASKWYNGGKENLPYPELRVDPMFKEGGMRHTLTYDDHDADYPNFLIDVFYKAGKAEAPDIKTSPKGEKENAGEDADSNTAGNGVNVEKLPGRGQADGAADAASGSVREDAGTVLAGVPSEDVQRTGGQEKTASDAPEVGGSVPQQDGGNDAQRDPGESGEGDNLGGSVQSAGGKVKKKKTKKSAAEAIDDAIEEQSIIPKNNYIIPAEGLNLPTEKKDRFRANADAIRIAKAIEADRRLATDEEKAALSLYVGWGGIPEVFDERARIQEQWGKEFEELKALLTDEEYKQARASTTNAHYTDIGVIRGMYSALKAMGFDGGSILEPSSGVGNFIGAMPPVGRPTNWLAVELDPITSLIAKHLYPASNVVNDGFQSANIPNNYFDVAIGNVPFSKTGVTDKTYPKYLTSPLHNYFFVKAIDKVREGGVLMFITSRFTMDGKTETFRKYMATKADLLGAVRLPSGAFDANAGTEVVTDILVFKKRAAGTEYAGQDFIGQGVLMEHKRQGYPSAYNQTYEGNIYFANNPDMVLGDMYIGRGMYQNNELMYQARTDTPLGDQVVKALSKLDYKFDYEARNQAIRNELADLLKPKDTKKPDGAVVVEGGKVYRVKNGKKHIDAETTAAPGAVKVISGLFELRDLRNSLLSAQLKGASKSDTDLIRAKLNAVYDSFVKENGFINNPKTLRYIKEDPDVYGIMSLEDYTPANKRKGKPEQAKKSAIFSQNTVEKRTKVKSAETALDAVSISMNEIGHVSIERVAELLGISAEEAERQIIKGAYAFKGADGAYIPAEVYLSGEVRKKLREAQALANVDPSYKPNVNALEKVIPADVKYEDIHISLGAAWIPIEVYKSFIMDVLQVSEWDSDGVSVQRMSMTNKYKIELSSKVKSQSRSINEIKYRAGRNTFVSIVEKIMNDSSFQVKEKVTDEYGNEKSVVSKEATALNNEKAEQIKTLFKEWIAKNSEVSAPLLRLYNDTFNGQIEPSINGDLLTIEGASPLFELRKHQKDVIQRAMNLGGNMLIAHAVGAGKTAEMAGIAMKMRQLGILKKPMFVVPKRVATGWGTEFIKFFPSAKVLVPSDSDYKAVNRKALVNRIATGDYDAVIVSQEIFESIPMSAEATKAFYQQQIDEMLDAMHEFQLAQAAENENAGYSRRGGKAKTDFTVKQIEAAVKRLQKKLDDISSKNKQDADNITFESLGVDGLFVDEAQDYKNLFVFTKLGNVQGLGKSDAGLTLDMLQKVRYMQKFNGGKGIFFATATPVMNSLSELYVMMKYLIPDTLAEKGIESFDAWAKTFAEVTYDLQLNVTGDKNEVKRVLSRYKNLPELQSLVRMFADILVEVEGLKHLIPDIKGGKAIINEVEAGGLQIKYMKELVERAQVMKGKKPEPGGDNMLKISDDGRMISYSAITRYPGASLEPNGKIVKIADNVTRVWQETVGVKGTQLVFMDRGVNENEGSPSLYKILKQQLILRGIPENEIAFVNDADDEVKRAELFEDVRSGDIRVLIGTSAKMGVGVNIQDRVAAIHHADSPWRPGDLIQRDGRAFRQGNMFKNLGGVELHYYVTKGTFDAYMWQKIKVKAAFIQQVMSGKNSNRESEGEGMALTAAEVTAIATGNPIVLEQFTLMGKIERINALRRQHEIDLNQNTKRLSESRSHVEFLKTLIKRLEADSEKAISTKGDDFSMTVMGKTYANRSDAGGALIKAYMGMPHDVIRPIGQFAGFEMTADKNGKILLSSQSGLNFTINPESAAGTTQSAETAVGYIYYNIKKYSKQIKGSQEDIAALEAAIAEPFAKEQEYAELISRYNEVMAELGPSASESGEYLEGEGDGADAILESLASEEGVDYSLRRISSPDFLQTEDKTEDRQVLVAELDAAPNSTLYMAAVESGDMDTAQKMVDEAAKASGHVKAWHNTNADFTVFDKALIGTNQGTALGRGFYVSLNETAYKDGYGKKRMGLYAKAENPYDATVNRETAFTKQQAEMLLEKYGNPRVEGYDPESELYALATSIYNEGVLTDLQDKRRAFNRLEYLAKEAGTTREAVLQELGYDGVVADPQLMVFDANQLKSADPVTYDNNGKIIPLSQRFNPKSNDIRYSDRDPSRLTAREQLSSAFESITKTDIDKQIIEQYKGKLEKVEADVKALREINAKIKELSFAPGKRDMDELTKLKNNKVTLSNRIARTDSMLTRIENAQPMRQLIAHEKKKAENAIRAQEAQRMAEYRERMEGKVKEAKEKGKENLDKYKGKVSDRSFRAAIKEIAEELTTWINNPDKNARVPQVLRRVIGDFLVSLNLQSKRAIGGGDSTKADRELYERMNTLALTLNNINAFQNGEKVVEGMYQEIAGFFDMPAGFQQTLGEMVENIRKLLEDSSGDYVINRMAGEELEQLHYILKILRKSVTQMNKLLSNAAFEHVDTLGNRTIAEMELIKRDNQKNGAAYRFFNWENTMPVYAFDRFGTGGKAVFESLQNGADRLSMIAAEIKNYAEKTFTAKESREWSDELHAFSMDGEQVKLTTWHLMGLYSMSQREQAKGHLYGEGIRVGNFQHKGQTISSKGHTLTPGKVQAMIGQLTARQKDVADKLQRFMNDRGGELGNQVTMVRFGVDMYEEKQYYPLESDKAHLASDTEGPEAGGLYRLLNLSFSKKLQKKANNRVMLYSMIDVFANHMSDMAQYNALALPVLDAVKWLNYQESMTTNGQKLTDSIKDVMRDAFGDAANSYITHLLRDINGTRMTGDENAFAMKRLRAFNRAQVAANLRVALLQPLSIVRAGMVMNPGAITKGMFKNIAMLKKNMAEMDKYAGIAQWKQLGFYDVNLSRSMQSIIKQDDTLGERIADKSMWLPQQMDRITWAAIWQASKEQTSSMEEAAKLFRDTIYRTQVVDSILTRSDYMRNSSFLHKWTSSFMSEPTLSYNIVMSSAHSYADDLAKGMKKADAWQKHGKKIARAVTVYAANAIVVTLMQSLMSAWRDDDDYSTFGQKFAEGFKSAGFDNLNVINLPLVSEMWEGGKRIIAKIFPESGIYGFDNESVITAFLDYFVDAVDVFAKHINGDKTSTTLWGGAYKLLQGLSVMTGFPMASATREVTSVWNNTVAEYAPSMKVLTYTGGKYQGYENLYKALQADNEDRIEQLRNTLAMRGADSKTVYGGLRDVVKEQFIAGKITEQDAIDLLKDEEGSPKNENDVYWLVQKWKEGGDAGYSKFDKMASSVMTGTGLKEAVQELLKNGTGKSAISAAITDNYKDQYIEAYRRSKTEAAALKARLLNAYVLLGYDRAKKSKDIDDWLKQ